MMHVQQLPIKTRRELDRLKYSDPVKILYEIDGLYGLVEGGGSLIVIGDPENACYEWVHLDEEKQILRHSNDGYGIAQIALRDGLCAIFGGHKE